MLPGLLRGSRNIEHIRAPDRLVDPRVRPHRRRYRTVQIQVGTHAITAADPARRPPASLRPNPRPIRNALTLVSHKSSLKKRDGSSGNDLGFRWLVVLSGVG